jgi:hypothetical protein
LQKQEILFSTSIEASSETVSFRSGDFEHLNFLMTSEGAESEILFLNSEANDWEVDSKFIDLVNSSIMREIHWIQFEKQKHQSIEEHGPLPIRQIVWLDADGY